jgi:hypothetical protein
MGKPLDHCVTIVSSKPNNREPGRAGSLTCTRTLPDTMVKGTPIPAYNQAGSSGLACTRTLPDTMVKGTPIIPLRKEIYEFCLSFFAKRGIIYLKKEDCVKLWSLARTSTKLLYIKFIILWTKR